MNHPIPIRLALASTLALLAGCSSQQSQIDDASKADFSDPLGNDNRKLIRPPNVIAEQDSVLLQLDVLDNNRLLPDLKQARIRHDGVVRWLEVDLPPGSTWQVVRSFWQDEGFGIAINLPASGFLETDWQQDRSQVLGTGLSRYIDAALGTINDTGIRNQFRTRIEQGDNAVQTNIFITHRSIEQGGIGTDGSFKQLPSDRILEVEMMRRMMIAFRLPEESIASLDSLTQQNLADDLYTLDGNALTILRSRATAWRRLLLALDRAGFTVTAKDADTGVISMLTADPTLPEGKIGFFANLLGSGQEGGEPREISLTVSDLGDERVQVTAPATEEGATILRIIAENL